MKIKIIVMTFTMLLLCSTNTNAKDRIIAWGQSIPKSTPSYFQDLQEMSTTTWFSAANTGDLVTIKAYLAAGFDVDTLNTKRRSALHCASLHGHRECVAVLIDAGAQVALEDDYSTTPMHSLAQEGMCNQTIFAQILSLFIEAGFKIDTPNYRGETALHVAVLSNKIDFVTELIKNGAKVNAKDQKERTPLRLLEGKSGDNVEQIRAILIHHGGTL